MSSGGSRCWGWSEKGAGVGVVGISMSALGEVGLGVGEVD